MHNVSEEINVISPRLYMKMLLPLLKVSGMNIKGTPRYISGDTYFDNFHKITISTRCVISRKCVFLTHDYSPTVAFVANDMLDFVRTDVRLDGDIFLEENVFVGLGVTILPDTKIGKNTIIGAGAVVKGVFPPNSIIVGNPARLLNGGMERYFNKCMSNRDKFIRDKQ